MLLVVSLATSFLLIFNIIPVNPGKGVGIGNGLDYGLDFVGGTQIQLRLEKPLSQEAMSVEKGILENRMNAYGLKDIPVRDWGDRYILIQIAGASPDEMDAIEKIIKQQARFEERIDGEIVVRGDEISLDLSPRGASIARGTKGYKWEVVVKHNPKAACRFGEIAKGKKGHAVDLFLDRPENTVVIFSEGTYKLLKNVSAPIEEGTIFHGDNFIHVLENRSSIPVIVYYQTNSTKTLKLLEEVKQKRNITSVILGGDETRIPESFRSILEERGLKTERIPQGNLSYEAWLKTLSGLESSPTLQFETHGECVYSALITGSSSTLKEARDAIKRYQILLTSGNLPAKAVIVSRSTTPPTLGTRFLRYSLYTGIMAIFTVSLVLYLRYRTSVIVIPVLITGLSEVIIILGLAALINWNLDLPAIAGIIAAVGTGVDHQIVITDETLKPEERGRRKIVHLGERIRRAFFIIFTAAATTFAAMLPLISIGAGMLRGFAFTTIMGVTIGVFITRPAYAAILRQKLQK